MKLIEALKRLIIIATIILIAASAGAKDKITQKDLDAEKLKTAQAVSLALRSKAETMQLKFAELQKQIQKNALEIKRLTPPPKKKEKKKGKK